MTRSGELTSDDIYLFREGTRARLHRYLDAHPTRLNGTAGTDVVSRHCDYRVDKGDPFAFSWEEPPRTAFFRLRRHIGTERDFDTFA